MDTRSDITFQFKKNLLSFEVTRLPFEQVAIAHICTVMFYGIKSQPKSIVNMITGETIPDFQIVYDPVYEKLSIESLDFDVLKSSLDESVGMLKLNYPFFHQN